MSQQRNPPTRLRRSHSYYSTSSYISIGEDHHDALEEAQPVLSSTTTTPLPWRQIVVIGLMRISEPISLTLIFPFINDFIWDLLGATTDRSKVGMYAGVVESLFSLMQFATVLQWARASDRLGRRPILLNGLLGSSISSLCIGFSTSFPMLVAARALSGALNGNVAIYKAVIGEITDRTNAARAFSVLPLTWSCGMVLGPLIGGYLSRPAHRYPTWFAEKEHGALAFGGLWERYPYLLPCLMAACINWSSIVLGYLFLEETEPTIVAARKQRQQEAHLQEDERRPLLKASDTTLQQRYTSNSSAFSRLTTSSLDESRQDILPPAQVQPTALTAKAPGIMDLLKIGHIRRIMLSYSLLALCSISLDSVNVLYFWEPILLGGLSFPSTITGTLMSSAGVLGVSIQLGLFPYLQRRLGTLPLFRYAIYGLLIAPVVMPMANVVARSGLQAPSEHRGGFEQDVAPVQRVIVLLLAATAMACKTASAMGFSCIIILVNQSAALAPGAQMGTLNGLAQMSSSAMFAVGPYAASSLFALTIERHLLGGYLIWAVLFAVALTGVYLSHGLLDVEKLVERGDIADEAANRRR